ncbi:MAG: glycosyltransferase family 2 protein [Acidobacteriota bacterium]
MKKKKPVLSIITVVKNGEQYLSQTIKSVIDQKFEGLEYIIIDGGSTDKSIEIIKKYEDKIDKWISEPDSGIYDAMNKGLALSSGEWVWYINSDDYLEGGAVKFIFNNNSALIMDAGIIYGNLRRIGDGYNYSVKQRNLKDLNKIITFSHPSTLIRRGLLEDAGGFDLRYKLVSDYDLIYRIAKMGPEVVYINKTFANMRHGGASERLSNSFKRIRERFIIDRKNISLGKACKIYVLFLLPGLFKKILKYALEKLGMKRLISLYFKKKY